MNYTLSHLRARSVKPREDGLTMVMDKGLSLRQAEDLVDASGHLVDMVKLGFGTSYVSRLKEKIALYRSAEIAYISVAPCSRRS
jgi:phosphosulfolactate synthase